MKFNQGKLVSIEVHWRALLKIFACFALLAPIQGCEEAVLMEPAQNDSEVDSVDAGAEELRRQNEPVAPRQPASEISLVGGSLLADIAGQLDQVAIVRSSALPEVQAAQAKLRALAFERYPQIRPTAAAPLTGGDASFGLNIEQLIWDGGRIRGRLTDSELKVATASLRAWDERNATVYDGLKAYVDIARYEARIAALTSLKQELDGISALLEDRLDGGIADRGELLRMTSALQSVERKIMSDRSSMRQAQTEFQRLLPEAKNIATLSNLGVAASQCSRAWPDSEAPADALSRVSLSRTRVAEDVILAQRFPKIVLAGGSTYSRDGWSDPAIGIQLDASDMLGLGRRGNVDAATASTRAAEASYALQKDETQAALAQLEADNDGLIADAVSLRALVQQSQATLDLYKEQLDAASIPLTEGIVLYREATDTLISLVDVESDVVVNCLRSSQQRGLLARFEAVDAGN